jgi:hypothetical protein
MKPKKTYKKYLTGGTVGAIAQGVMGAGQAAYGMYQANKASKEMDRLRASAPSLETPGEYFQAHKQAADQSIMERQMESVNKQVAGGAQALGAAGGRALLGGLGAMTQGAQEMQMNIADTQSQRQQQALQALAGAQQQTTQLREGRYQQEMGSAAAARDAGLQNVAGGLGAIGSAATMGLAAGMDANKAKAAAGYVTPTSFYKSIGIKKGGGIVKTPGQFSHEKNPIDIVKGGAKIGEMTGGEYVFNPTQISKIKSHVATGDKEALHRYVKGLIKKFEK